MIDSLYILSTFVLGLPLWRWLGIATVAVCFMSATHLLSRGVIHIGQRKWFVVGECLWTSFKVALFAVIVSLGVFGEWQFWKVFLLFLAVCPLMCIGDDWLKKRCLY